MRLLLDTHTLLWVVERSPRLSRAASDLIGDRANQLFVSAASLWESAIKRSLGKLQLDASFDSTTESYLEDGVFTWLPIEMRHIRRVATLPFHHRDPFDRMLVAQALEEDLTLLSSDAALDGYAVKRAW